MKTIDIQKTGYLIRSGETPQGGRTISGYAIVFDQWSDEQYDPVFCDVPFKEIISRNAVSQELIDESDIYLTFNHDDDKVLGRKLPKEQGVGSLKVTLDNIGVKFELELPDTDLGNSIKSYVERGELSKCSFAARIKSSDSHMEQDKDGNWLHYIDKICFLHDLSLVWVPAYSSTTLSKRSKIIESNEDMTEEEIKALIMKVLEDKKEVEEPVEKEEQVEEPKVEEPKEEETTTTTTPQPEEEPKEEVKEEVEDVDDYDQEKEVEKEEQEETPKEKEIEEKRNKNIFDDKTMNKSNFSLMNAIRSKMNGNKMDTFTSEVFKRGRKENQLAGVDSIGEMVLPTQRALVSVANEHDDVVSEEFGALIDPLHYASALQGLNVKTITGLTGDYVQPIMGVTSTFWGTEGADAQDGAPTYTSKKFTPHRLCAYVDLTKQFLLQTQSIDAENALIADLNKALADKLEDTIFSNAAADTTNGIPAGIFAGKTATKVTNFKGLCDVEAVVENAKYNPANCEYLLNPSGKAFTRSLTYGGKSTRMVYENGDVDGIKATVSGHLDGDVAEMVYGDFSNLVVTQWGGINITIDDKSLAISDKVRVVISGYFDFKLVREDAVALATSKE